MAPSSNCPLCGESYGEKGDLRVHLEVEHRKSELARYLLAADDRSADPVASREAVDDEPPAPSL
ncbi:C2H2-type zinc finger protein [Salinilacihabitans rarus]|uniref:C2H2-type zinc finger protein n=1 Tax=Salinilacihabitans rarus TaxID=2961596 RepID=UPI0020C8CC4F|nr:C2H2-type zinc finger protein [Salinilacihabitans rarus]